MKKHPNSLVWRCFTHGIAISILFASCKKTEITTPNVDIHSSSPLSTTTRSLKVSPTSVTLPDATAFAKRYLEMMSGKEVDIKNAETIVKNGIPYMHIINASDGFAIIATDSINFPILAYNTAGMFDKTNLNGGLLLWLDKQAYEYEFIRTQKTKYTDSIANHNKEMWEAYRPKNVSIADKRTQNISETFFSDSRTYSGSKFNGPYCNTSWSQDAPFNKYCPSGTGGVTSVGHMPAGCIPLAMAQIMYFWKSGTAYNWAAMHPVSGTDEAARLIHDVGASTVVVNPVLFYMQMNFVNYGVDGSSADDSYCPDVFRKFGYSCTRTETLLSQSLSGSNNGTYYADLLDAEITVGRRPCMLSGYPDQTNRFFGYIYTREGTGHEWIAEGSQQDTYTIVSTMTALDRYGREVSRRELRSTETETTMLYLNWGWGRSNNGWYNYKVNYTQPRPIDPVIPLKNYQYFQTIIYNIRP